MTTPSTPTFVLVHGAFADASGFGGVIRELQTAGHTVAAPPNPLRSIAFDAAAACNNPCRRRCWLPPPTPPATTRPEHRTDRTSTSTKRVPGNVLRRRAR
jgi:hypothetical protein